MSILIQKSGLLDTIQDAGRYGHQHLGINTGGVMDTVAMQVANALVGNVPGEAVLEMHFPAAEIMFTRANYIALAGADFAAKVDGRILPLWQPILVNKGTVLRFTKKHKGERVYLAIRGGFEADAWLNSYSTHLKVKAGGYKGRALQKNDRIIQQSVADYHLQDPLQPFQIVHWGVNVSDLYRTGNVLYGIPGAEYGLLDAASKKQLEEGGFTITAQTDRMGYRIEGNPLQLEVVKEMISSGVTRGTVQLLPNGQMIILMADHQTTGGYPRIVHIINADLPTLAQLRPGESFQLRVTDIQDAEKKLASQERYLTQIRNACSLQWKAMC